MNSIKASLIAGIGLLFMASSAPAFEIPFPPTSYKESDELRCLPEQPAAALFVVMDETTSLNKHRKTHRQVQELAVNWLAPGRAVQVIRFSSYVPGRDAEIVTSGLLNPEPSDDCTDGMKRSKRREFNRLHKEQIHAAKAATTKAIRKVFANFSTDIPKSEILFNIHRLSEHIRNYKATRKVILLVSDMMENSSVTSFYQAGGVRKISPEAEIAKAKDKGVLSAFGEGVIVHIVGLGYGAKGYLDSDRVSNLEAFWRQYFQHGNATVEEFGKPLLLRGLK